MIGVSESKRHNTMILCSQTREKFYITSRSKQLMLLTLVFCQSIQIHFVMWHWIFGFLKNCKTLLKSVDVLEG